MSHNPALPTDPATSGSQRFHQLFDKSSDHLITLVAERTVAAILHAWRDGREAQIVLTGGRTGLSIAQSIDVALFRASSQAGLTESSLINDSVRVRIWFSDERFLSLDSPDRSDTTVIGGFSKSLSHICFERVTTPDLASLDEAASAYALALETRLGSELRFDAVILSMGEDGHIASLFPGHTEQLNSPDSAIAVDNSPKPPAARVSIGVARLAQSSAVYIFALGEGKRGALGALLAGSSESEASPISMLRKNSPATQVFIATDLKL
jgi:6-phosphogluconolactonase